LSFVPLIAMYFSAILSLSTALLGLVSTTPVVPGLKLGATYTMTNKAANSVFVTSIQADGTISFAREVATGGAGSPLAKGDPLGSQNSVVVAGGVPI
jgi:hypothetical protein